MSVSAWGSLRIRPAISSKAAGSTRRSAVSSPRSRRALSIPAADSSPSTDAARVTAADISSPI